jgi:hypothetical protein
MCQQVQTVTLQTAILKQVAKFADNNSVFSVHDITIAIRNKAASGELEIPEVEVQGASFRFDIPHSKVKALFDELYHTGVFDTNYRLDRSFNGTYYEYTPTGLNSNSTPAVAPSPTTASPTPAAPATAPATAPAGTISTSNVARIGLYLSNCATRQFQPTLRQVQSAIKRNDFIPIPSCEELKQYITSLGYTIVYAPDSLSHAQVVTK